LWLLSIIVVAAACLFAGRQLRPSNDTALARRFHLDPEGYQAFYPNPPALSPDGRFVAYFTGAGLHIRDLQSLESIAIPQSQRATSPFWSPDAAWLAFGMEGSIHKVPATGGNPTIICKVPFGALDGGTWGDDNMLYLAPNTGPIYVVSEHGGDAKPLFTPDAGESDYHTPSALPGATAIVFTTHNPNGRDTVELFANNPRRILLHIPGARLEYAAWSALPGSRSKGHLVFHRQNTNVGIWALPFDLNALAVTGDPFLLDSNGAFPSVATDGSLLYSVGSAGGLQQLVLVNRKGEVLSRIGQPQLAMSSPRLSPDGSSVLVSSMEGDSRDLWLHDIERGTRTKMTFSNEPENHPNWLDARTISFSRSTSNASTWSRSADGSSEPQLFADGYHLTVAPGSRLVAFNRFLPGTGQDLFYQELGSEEPAKPFLQTMASEVGPELSPDGNYIIYMSDESGGNEIYMKPFPSGEGKWQVSTNGGAWAKWSRAGDEIIYRSGVETGATMMSVAVRTTPSVQLGTPVILFQAEDVPQLSFQSGFAAYDTTNDPGTLVMLERAGEFSGPEAGMVFAAKWYASYRDDRH
jgi:Tol biopolymer transport system component